MTFTNYTSRFKSAEEALSVIKSGDSIFIHTAAAAPKLLVEALADYGSELSGVNIYQLHTEGEAPYAEERCREAFHINALFVGPNVREAVHAGRGSYIPAFLSEVPKLFRRGVIELDVALISVSPPDKHGICSLGPSVDSTLAAVESAHTVIAQVNSHVPRTHGDGWIHIDQIDHLVEGNVPIYEIPANEPDELQLAIGNNVAQLIEDGATLQMGIGAIPNAVLSCLGGHQDLGIHSEMFSDGIIPLVEKGVITGRNKESLPGMIVSTFVLGTKQLYDFVDDNPMVKLLDCEFVNNTKTIRENPKATAINSAIEIDLTGQICADSIGDLIYSGVGGQMDFMRGASLSLRGKPIIAMPSTTNSGKSKIVSQLKPGAGVVTTRAHVHWVVTEFGAVNLYGRSLKERSDLLISIAHPEHREDLLSQAFDLLER